MHATIGIHSLHWSSIIQAGLEQVFGSDVEFRRSLPMGFAGEPEMKDSVASHLEELLKVLQDKMVPAVMAAEAVDSAHSLSSGEPRGRLVEIMRTESSSPVASSENFL